MIFCDKNEYILRVSKKLNDSSTAPKSYLSILNWLLNNNKIPGIPPIFQEGKVISDFKKTVNLFNSFVASECAHAFNSGVLPDISFQMNTFLNSFSITKNILDSNKSHGWDNISINIKTCG